MNETHSVDPCGEDIEVLESLTHPDSIVHNTGGPRQEVLQHTGLTRGVMDSLTTNLYMALSMSVKD